MDDSLEALLTYCREVKNYGMWTRERVSLMQERLLASEDSYQEPVFLNGVHVSIVDVLTYIIGNAGHDEALGAILYACYKNGSLMQPLPDDSSQYLGHISMAVRILIASNEILYFHDLCWGLQETLAGVFATRSLEEILGITIECLIQLLHAYFSKTSTLEGIQGPTFAMDDLNIDSLRSIGRLSIRWTPILEDHMLLNDDDMTLSIAWFPVTVEYGLFAWHSVHPMSRLQQL